MLPLLLLSLLDATPAVDFDNFFLDKTMRLDYFHSGTAKEEHFALDRVVSDGVWPGSKRQLIDTLDFGKYQFEVRDAAAGTLLYSYGFATIFGEWETTGEANRQWGTFHESLRFPWPRQPVTVKLFKRDPANRFVPIWEVTIPPDARWVNPADPATGLVARNLMENGPPAEKVDLLMLGDGYTDMERFKQDAERLTAALFSEEPFKSRRLDFNVRTVETPATVAGVSRPHEGVFRRPPLTTHYSSFDSQRYVLSYDNRRLREVAATVPYDYLVILVNERVYGGGGIYRWQATAAAGNAMADYLFVHEFGHHFASLADEYYTSSIAYELEEGVTVEPWEPNLTALLDPAHLKWKDLVTPGTPLPTPWRKEDFEKASRETQEKRNALRDSRADEDQLTALFEEQRKFETQLLGSMTHSGQTGAFEGAGYRDRGYYRPSADCLMFTRDRVGFCAVCRRALDRVIDWYAH